MKRTSLALGAAALAAAVGLAPAPAAALPLRTLENLSTAFNGESNAHARYLAFARKADAEGYARVASLFRAAARAEEIHARNHAEVIRKLGGSPTADVKVPEVKSTRENLEAAIQGESYERDTMYPGFLETAREEGQARAVRTLNLALQAEKGHAKLYGEALAALDAWKAKGGFYVCPTCGNTVATPDFRKCPACRTEGSKFEPVA